MHYLKEQKPLLEEKEIDDIQKNINQAGSHFWQNNFKDKINKVINYLLKILPLFTFFIIVLGISHIYKYLNFIHCDFLFPDVIGEPSSAITIIVTQILFSTMLVFGFLSPFLLNILVYTESSKNDTYLILKIFHTLSISYIAFNFICFIIAFFGSLSFDSFVYFSSFCFFILAVRACYILQTYYEVETTEIFILSLLVVIPYCLYFSISLYPIVQTVSDKYNFIWQVFIISHFLIAFNSFMAILYAKSRHKNHIFPTICIILVIFGYFHLIPYQNYEISLHKPKFIEKHNNSSWYIIHNGNATSETINGMTKDEIKYRQQSFIPNGWQQYCKDDVFNNINMQNCPTLRNENALYGYMAWNLGNAKVFCPQSVDFFDDKGNNKEKSEKCLVIDGKYLQLVSEYYLKRPMG